MKKLLVLLLILSSSFISAKDYKSCCFCILDTVDTNIFSKACKTNFRNKKDCNYKKTIRNFDFRDIQSENLSCSQVHIFAAVHSDESKIETPFIVADFFSNELNPNEVNYSSFACMTFNQSSKAILRAQELGNKYPEIKFTISSNQNQGYLPYTYILPYAQEDVSMSSKLTIVEYRGEGSFTYAACSKPKNRCSFNTDDKYLAHSIESTNTKICTTNNETTTQSCCQNITRRDQSIGHWSKPGEECPL